MIRDVFELMSSYFSSFFVWLGILLGVALVTVASRWADPDSLGRPVVQRLQVIEFDGCEYIENYHGSGTSVTHKGNCKYCEARRLPRTIHRAEYDR